MCFYFTESQNHIELFTKNGVGASVTYIEMQHIRYKKIRA